MEAQELEELLAQACPRPSFLAASDGGAVLSLALHCMMVHAGFEVLDEAGPGARGPERRYVPPQSWNGAFVDQWVFEYTRPGKANKFTLHCSLQTRTKRMFIHASEDNNPPNTAVLGLQLDNYVPDPTLLKTSRWAGVVANVPKAYGMFAEHIIFPLQARAEELAHAPGPVNGEVHGAVAAHRPAGALSGVGEYVGWLLRAPERRPAPVVLIAAAVLTVAVAAVAAQRLRSRGSSSSSSRS